MLNCLLIKKMESYPEMDLYYITVIFHWDDFEQYVLLPVFHQMRLGLNLPVERFALLKAAHCTFLPLFHRLKNLIMIFISALILSLDRVVLPGSALAPSSLTLVDNMLELPSVLLQTSGTFFILSLRSFLVIWGN